MSAITRIEHIRKLNEIKLKAKALYLIGDIQDVYAYIDGMIEYGYLTEEEEEEMMNSVSSECANITVSECQKLYTQIAEMH